MLSVVLVVRNEAENIAECLESIKDLAEDIVVVDGYSTDDTVKIAKSYGSRVFQAEPKGYTEPFREFGITKAKGEWILNLDADEVVTKELAAEIISIIQKSTYNSYWIPRKNMLQKKHWVRFTYPDYQLRLYKKDGVKFTSEVHNGVHAVGQSGRLKEPMIHYSFRSWKQLEEKRDRVTTIEAENLLKNTKMTPFNTVKYMFIRPLVVFIYYLIARGAWKNGRGDLLIAYDSLLYNMQIAQKAIMMENARSS